MSSMRPLRGSWRCVCLLAITYVYFLIFAQFAFLRRLAELGIAETHLKVVMAAMAAGGILFSLLAARPLVRVSPRLRLQAGFAMCACAAFLIVADLGLGASIAVALLIGCGLGLVTVTLVTHLGHWLEGGHRLFQVGLGTGLGYFLCNLPVLFTAPARMQAMTAAGLCLLGVLAAAGGIPETQTPGSGSPTPVSTIPFLLVLASFTALIWLDSGAFFIIQNTPALKAGTWQGTLHLWANGSLHLVAALGCAWLLHRRSLSFVLSLAVLSLSLACLLLLDPNRAPLASFFYPIGVSLYSVALVAYPSLLLPGSSVAERAQKAGWIYAIAGWIGSAMGIGMAQHLGHIPVPFVVTACVVVFASSLPRMVSRYRRELTTVSVILLTAFGASKLVEREKATRLDTSPIARGRSVYLAEGCIHCHSQYVRPNTPDELLWGPTQTLAELRAQRPPLIGNRRQGPDLSEVGGRRSPLWLKAHLIDPRALSDVSFMPAYSHLFQPGENRGDDLVIYLSSLQGSGTSRHIAQENAWQPSQQATRQASIEEGARLFVRECATCHDPHGATRRTWQADFRRVPPDLPAGLWPDEQGARVDSPKRLAQIIKFGLPGTDMPGHEYFSDADVLSLSLWLQSMRRP